MDAEDQLKLDIISMLNAKNISVDQARQALGVSERSIMRYWAKFLKEGPVFVFHGNHGRTPVNKITSELSTKAMALIKEKYFDFNMTHALEKLAADEGIKINRETFRKICHEQGMVKKAKRRKQHPRYARDRMAQAGVMLQMDGSPERWFGGKQSCLIGAIDDATSEVPYAEFFESESTLACMKVLMKIIQMKGLFNILYVDRAGIYGGPKRVQFSQVKRALRELGIQIIFANSPQAKGRIERLWGTLQDRIIPEMRLKKIKTYEAANDYLINQYLPNEHNPKFKVLAKDLNPAWRVVPAAINLQEIFCIKDRRTVKNDHTYSWNGQAYKITSDLKYSIFGQQVEVRTYPDDNWKVFFADKQIDVVQHHRQPQVTIDEKVTIILAEKEAIKVRLDGHVYYENKYYSVAEEFVGKQINVREQGGVLLLYHRAKLVESHQRLVGPFQKASTKPEHLGPWKKSLLPQSVYRKAASAIGPNCDRVILQLLENGKGVVDNKSIWGILSLKDQYNRSSLEEACDYAFNCGMMTYSGVSTILSMKYRKLSKTKVPA